MRALLLLAVCSTALACSSKAEPPEPARRSSTIEGGQADSEHRNVVGLFLMTQRGQGICTGTLILPNLVLTARHCVSPVSGSTVTCGSSPFGTPYPGSAVYVTTDTQMEEHSTWYAGAQVHVPPTGNDTCGYDMALVRLRSSVPASVTAPAVPRIDSDPSVGERYAAVGFGSTGFDQGGTRMILRGLEVQCAPGTCPPWGIEDTEWLGETGVCQGDSGGPALDSTGRVIGVVSRGAAGCETPVYGSVSRWKDWILEVAREAVSAGGYPAPAWVLDGCTDASCGAGTGGAGTGGAGAGGAGGDAQGAVCTGYDCPAGYLCIDRGDGTPFYCTARCSSEDSSCPTGTRCAEEIGACLEEARGAAGSAGVTGTPGGTGVPDAAADTDSVGGCTVSAAGPVKPLPWSTGLVLLATVCWTGRRRRR